jgi:hypothetical protein
MNHAVNPSIASHRQRGTALLFSMIILVALTFIGVAAVNTGVMEVRMAGHLEEQMNAFQTAQAVIDYVISDSGNLPATGPLNTPSTVALPDEDPFTVNTGETLTAQAERVIDCGQPPRIRGASSLLAFSSFSYKISADVDKVATGRGQSYQRQGYMILGPKC